MHFWGFCVIHLLIVSLSLVKMPETKGQGGKQRKNLVHVYSLCFGDGLQDASLCS